MSRPAKLNSRAVRRTIRVLGTFLALPLLMAGGLAIQSTVAPAALKTPPEPATAPAVVPVPGNTAASSAGYLLRCWQHGQLILEEPVRDPPTGSNTVRMGGNYLSSVWLVPVGSGVCQVRPATERRMNPVVQ